MTGLQIIVLAVVQGLTEFLPISSSGHLVLVPYLVDWADQGLAFDVAVHFGSLIAVAVFFREDILGLLRGALQQPCTGCIELLDAGNIDLAGKIGCRRNGHAQAFQT